ncbi:MAG: VOC family protein [Myxococcales bacterium]|nr:VOC family protein [Myxococcales bacterium]
MSTSFSPALFGVVATLAACAGQGGEAQAPAQSASSSPARGTSAVTTAAVARYQVADIERSLAFYTQRLGFSLEQRSGPVFASVTRGNLRLLLSGPGSSGSRPMPDGRKQESGGWNRIVLYVENLDAQIAALKAGDVAFRNEVEQGPGGSQILIDDPDGNAIELHQEPSPPTHPASK